MLNLSITAMNRQDDNRNELWPEDKRYQGYDRRDSHYHHARNLSDDFERDYRHSNDYRGDARAGYHPGRSYHEGDMGDAYERLSQQNRYGNLNRRDRDYGRNYYPENENRYGNPDRDRGEDWNYGNRVPASGRGRFEQRGPELNYPVQNEYRNPRHSGRRYGSNPSDSWYSSGQIRDDLNRH